jgi:hypothetical protein
VVICYSRTGREGQGIAHFGVDIRMGEVVVSYTGIQFTLEFKGTIMMDQ